MNKKRVVVEHGVLVKMADILKCTPQYVGKCLRFVINTDRAASIRTMAIRQFKGKEVEF